MRSVKLEEESIDVIRDFTDLSRKEAKELVKELHHLFNIDRDVRHEDARIKAALAEGAYILRGPIVALERLRDSKRGNPKWRFRLLNEDNEETAWLNTLTDHQCGYVLRPGDSGRHVEVVVSGEQRNVTEINFIAG